MDLFDKCDNFQDARMAQQAGLYPFFIPLSQTEGTEVTVNGHKLIMIGSNNYLGLTTHPRVKQAAIEAIETYGTSCTGSRLANGTLKLHEELDKQLAEFVGKEAALVFSTGFQVNLGVISALVQKGDYVIIDKEDHASIIDGCLLARGEMKRFRHNDVADLERVLAPLPKEAAKLVVVDGVFSMAGDIAPLPEIIPLCKEHNARLMVDDAHGLGVVGGGRGTSAHFGVTEDVDLIMGTFSKSFASMGGFIAGDEQIVHYIKHFARAFIFSASMTPSNVAAALAALQVMKKEPEHVERVNAIATRMRKAYTDLGFDIGTSCTPIIPIIVGDDTKTLFAWRALYDAGVYTNAVLTPGVPPGKSLLRTSYMATHTDEQMDRVLGIFERVGKDLGLI